MEFLENFKRFAFFYESFLIYCVVVVCVLLLNAIVIKQFIVFFFCWLLFWQIVINVGIKIWQPSKQELRLRKKKIFFKWAPFIKKMKGFLGDFF